MEKIYDYLIVGAGITGSVIAYELNRKCYKCLVIDRRNHIGGNCYTENVEGVNVHKYGAHIFRTNDLGVWSYINRFAKFNKFINEPVAVYKNEVYNMPFNMNTFSRMFNVITPDEAKKKIEEDIPSDCDVETLKGKALSMVGRTIYEKLIEGYTEKQWQRKCEELPASIISEIPLRFTYSNNYFNEKYQGVPIGGYTQIFEKLLENIDVLTNTSYEDIKDKIEFKKIIYTGAIDEFYNYKYGPLEYRSLRFEEKILDCKNHQGNAVLNWTSKDVPYTRSIEHKHFEGTPTRKTVISYEYSQEFDVNKKDCERYYPINDDRNNKVYELYREEAKKQKEKIIFCGRLGSYRYDSMDVAITNAWQVVLEELDEEDCN